LFLLPVFVFFPHIALCSHSVLNSLPGILRRMSRGEVQIVQNGVDTDRVDRVLATFEGGGSEPRFKVVSVARLIERKNPYTTMAALEIVGDPNDTLTYVGDGDLRSSLVEQAQKMRLEERVKLTGTLSREDVYRCLFESDVFVSASYGEGLPVAVLEAMACGRPVILSDIPPHREVVGSADFVPLLSPDDIGGFAREIQRVKRMSPDERAALGEQCRKLVDDRFSLRAMHRSYENIYAMAMGQHSSPAGVRVASRKE
jgi:glycosyltransferase involved in cell wall biosynthesis